MENKIEEIETLQVKIPSNSEIFTQVSSNTKLDTKSVKNLINSSKKSIADFSKAEESQNISDAASLISVNEVFKGIRLEKAIESNQISIDKVIYKLLLESNFNLRKKMFIYEFLAK